jgi:hypothetical protein
VRDARKRARAKQTTTNREKERERVNDRSHPCRSAAVNAHERETTGAGIGNNSKKFKRVPSQTLRVWIFLCFFNQRIFSILAVILLLLAGGTTEEVILVLGDVSRQVVGRVHERELFRQVSRVGHFLLLKNSFGKGEKKMAHVCLGFWYKFQ